MFVYQTNLFLQKIGNIKTPEERFKELSLECEDTVQKSVERNEYKSRKGTKKWGD